MQPCVPCRQLHYHERSACSLNEIGQKKQSYALKRRNQRTHMLFLATQKGKTLFRIPIDVFSSTSIVKYNLYSYMRNKICMYEYKIVF